MGIDLSRREFLETAAVGVAGVSFSSAQQRAGASPNEVDELVARGLLVDTLSVFQSEQDYGTEGFAAWKKSGYTCIAASLSSSPRRIRPRKPPRPGTWWGGALGSFDHGMEELKEWQERFRQRADWFIHCTKAADIERAKREGKLAVLLGFQTPPIANELDQLDELYAAGTRWIQLTHNSRTLLADGSSERTNAGLSDFGVACVERMNELSIIVDLSHVGEASTTEAIALSRQPPCYTHTFCQALRWQSRGKPDYLLRALAEKGGVAGITMVGWFITPPERSIEKDGFQLYIDHVVHAVKVCGIDHVGMSQDRAIRGAEAGGWTPETAKAWVDRQIYSIKPIQTGQRWPHWIPELDKPDRFRTVAHALAKRGFKTAEIEKILGGNWVRYFRDIFQG